MLQISSLLAHPLVRSNLPSSLPPYLPSLPCPALPSTVVSARCLWSGHCQVDMRRQHRHHTAHGGRSVARFSLASAKSTASTSFSTCNFATATVSMYLLHSAFPSRCPAVHQKWPPPPTPSPHPPPSAYLFYTGGTVYGAVLLALIAPQVFLQVSEAVKRMPQGGGWIFSLVVSLM